MSVVHRITAYDQRGNLTFEHDVPSKEMDIINTLANVDAKDPEAIGSCPIQTEKMLEIGRILQQGVNAGGYSWFLEPFADDVG